MLIMSPRKNQKGAGLIEVLVTVLIMATSLLAMGALQSRSLQFNHSAYLRSQANVMAYDILDRIRINRDNVGSYSHTLGNDAPGTGTLAAIDVTQWLGSIQGNLPGGEGGIVCSVSTEICTVSIRWIDDDRRPGEVDEDDVQETTTFTYSTRI